MRKWVFVLCILMLAAGVASTLLLGAPVEKGLRTISGEISAIDVKALTMTLKNEVAGSGIEEVKFDVDPTVTVRMHGLRGKFDQLKFGDYVTVRYVEQDNKKVAKEIQHS